MIPVRGGSACEPSPSRTSSRNPSGPDPGDAPRLRGGRSEALRPYRLATRCWVSNTARATKPCAISSSASAKAASKRSGGLCGSGCWSCHGQCPATHHSDLEIGRRTARFRLNDFEGHSLCARFKLGASGRKRSDFQRISNFSTVQDGQPCDTEKNQSPRIPHENAQRRKISLDEPDGGTGGIRTLGSLLDYAPLARECFRPLSHRSG